MITSRDSLKTQLNKIITICTELSNNFDTASIESLQSDSKELLHSVSRFYAETQMIKKGAENESSQTYS